MTALRRAVALALLTAAPAFAAGPLDISTRMLVERHRIGADGVDHPLLVEPHSVSPGERVTVTLAYRNTGAAALRDLTLASPVPGGMHYEGAPADTPAPDVSVNGRDYAPLAALRVSLPGGGTRAANPADVIAVRWTLAEPLAPGAAGERRFHARLD